MYDADRQVRVAVVVGEALLAGAPVGDGCSTSSVGERLFAAADRDALAGPVSDREATALDGEVLHPFLRLGRLRRARRRARWRGCRPGPGRSSARWSTSELRANVYVSAVRLRPASSAINPKNTVTRVLRRSERRSATATV